MTRRRALASAAILSTALLAVGIALAHEVGLSRGEYRLESGVLDAQVTFARREVAGLVAGLDENGDGALSAAEVARSREAVSAALAGRIKVVGEGAPCAAELISAALADEDGLTVHARYRCPSAAPEVKVDLALLDDLPFGHRHLARLSGNSGPSDALLSRRDRRFTITASAPSSSSPSAAPPSPSSPLPAASSPFLAGVVRVFSRPDPSLLLLALAFGRREIRAIVFALLAFTAASIGGLVLAARGVWAPSSAVLGPALLIALAYVVVDDLLRASTTRPWSMALPFGLAQGAALALLPAAAIDLRAPSALTLFGLGAGLAEIALAALLIALVIARRQHRERGIAG